MRSSDPSTTDPHRFGTNITLAVLRDLRARAPGTPIVLWVDTISTEFASQAITIGVRGILRRTLPIEIQLKCLRKVASGELWIEQRLGQDLLCSERVPLSRRGSELVSLLCRGYKNKEIAFQMAITEGSVKVYLSKLYDKVGVSDRFELALYALKNTLGDLGSARLRSVNGAAGEDAAAGPPHSISKIFRPTRQGAAKGPPDPYCEPLPRGGGEVAHFPAAPRALVLGEGGFL